MLVATDGACGRCDGAGGYGGLLRRRRPAEAQQRVRTARATTLLLIAMQST